MHIVQICICIKRPVKIIIVQTEIDIHAIAWTTTHRPTELDRTNLVKGTIAAIELIHVALVHVSEGWVVSQPQFKSIQVFVQRRVLVKGVDVISEPQVEVLPCRNVGHNERL